jgi:hypothetical protein
MYVCLLQGRVHGEGGPHGHREHEEEGALGLHRSNYTEERHLNKDTMHPVFFIAFKYYNLEHATQGRPTHKSSVKNYLQFRLCFWF